MFILSVSPSYVASGVYGHGFLLFGGVSLVSYVKTLMCN